MSARFPIPWRAEGRDNGLRGRQRREWWAVLDRNGFFVAEGLDETTAREIVAAVRLDRRGAAAFMSGGCRELDASFEAERRQGALVPVAVDHFTLCEKGRWQ